MNEPPKISDVPARPIPLTVLPPEPPRGATDTPPIHPLSALALVVVDNLWNLAEFAVIDWVVTIPLSFVTVFVPVFVIQKRLKRNTTAQALGWALLLGVLAAVPFSVTGTLAGSAILAWLGLNKWLGRPRN